MRLPTALVKQWRWPLLGLAALLVLTASGLWCAKITRDPQRVFWSAIDRSLQTSSVTLDAKASSGGTNLKQVVQTHSGPVASTRSITEIDQKGTSVQNETIGSLDTDYSRYRSIKTDQKRPDGKKLDLSKVVGVWAKGEKNTNQLFKQAMLGVSLPLGGTLVPIGNLDSKARGQLLDKIQAHIVYQIDFKHVQKKRINGRLQYTYTAAVDPASYAEIMKDFAKTTGLKGLDQLDPAQYRGQKPTKVEITIDVRSHHVVRASLPGTDLAQNYSGYDLPSQIKIPNKTISTQELQKRLSNL